MRRPSLTLTPLWSVTLATFVLIGSAMCCDDRDAENFGELGPGSGVECIYAGCTERKAENYDPRADPSLDQDHKCTWSGCPSLKIRIKEDSASVAGSCCLDRGADNFEGDVYRFLSKNAIRWNLGDQGEVPDSLTTPENKACEYSGCTNPLATNYDDIANVDDGTCIVRGCTDGTATNFDETATIGDGSCLFDFGDDSGAGST